MMTAARELLPQVDSIDLTRDPIDALLSRFLDGQEETAELLARLALESGGSLLYIYERIRLGIAEAAGHPNIRSVRENELDESLVRLVARLRAPVSNRPDWNTCILSTDGRGVAACISHLMVEAGLASLIVAGLSDERSTMSGAETVALIVPGVKHIVIDGSRAHPEAIGRCLSLVQQLDFAATGTRVVLLADEGWRPDPTQSLRISAFVVVSSLNALMTALGITTDNPLTGREREVLCLVATGATNEQIARRLGVAVSTVKTYLERIHLKLRSRDRASAVAAAMQRKWL
jgi:DNA-binding CsgD family transcriptional regulator